METYVAQTSPVKTASPHTRPSNTENDSMGFYHNASPHRRPSNVENDSMEFSRNAAAAHMGNCWGVLGTCGHSVMAWEMSRGNRGYRRQVVIYAHCLTLSMSGFTCDSTQLKLSNGNSSPSLCIFFVTWSVSEWICIAIHSIRFTANIATLCSHRNI